MMFLLDALMFVFVNDKKRHIYMLIFPLFLFQISRQSSEEEKNKKIKRIVREPDGNKREILF
jgi:hypothetical protein